jgi:membrane-associated PAP2 superfamily phosphatase
MTDDRSRDRSAWLFLVVPTLVFLPVAAVFGVWSLDVRIAQHLAFDPVAHQFVARHAFWANSLLHTDGRLLIWATGLACLLLSALGSVRGSSGSPRFPRLHAARQDLAWAFGGMLLIILVIGVLKHVTNVDCPWNLTMFGGNKPYTGVFGARPPGLARGACFPGAHAGSGFALLSLYFAFRQSHRTLSRWLLIVALVVGTAFAVGQEERGAHFLSHDLWSAYLAWMLGAGCWILRSRWERAPVRHPADGSNQSQD